MLDRCAKFILYPAQSCCYFKLQSHSTHLIFGRAINCFKQAAHSPPAAGKHCMRLLLIMWSHPQPSHGMGLQGTVSMSAQQQLLPSLSAGLHRAATLPGTCKALSSSTKTSISASSPARQTWHNHSRRSQMSLQCLEDIPFHDSLAHFLREDKCTGSLDRVPLPFLARLYFAFFWTMTAHKLC